MFDPIENVYDLIAQGFEDAWPAEFVPEGFQADVGVGAALLPEYRGSDNYRTFAIPLVRITYEDFAALRNTKLTVNLLRYGKLRAGVLAKYLFGRRESRDPVLASLENIGDTIEVGAFARYDFERMIVTVEAREGISHGQGLTVRLNVAHGLYRTEKFRLGAAASAVWGSNERVETNFGVTEAEAAAALVPLRPFDADGGIYEVNAFLGGEYALNAHWRLGAVLGYTRLLADAADSPIVADYGSPNLLTAGLGLLYRF